MTTPAQFPDNETDRLARLRELLVLDSEPEAVFDSLVQLASELCGTPIALLSLIDADRQWFKAGIGLPGVRETPRDIAFCAHAILDDGVFEIADASQDPRFCDNPLVTGAPAIRFYAGAPLQLEGGERIGTLCVIDSKAHHLDAGQIRALQSLARIATQMLQMRRDLIERALKARSAYEQALIASEAQHRAINEEQSELVSLARPDGVLVYVNPAYARQFGRAPAELVGRSLFDMVEATDREAVQARLAQVLSTGKIEHSQNRMQAPDGSELWVDWSNSVQRDAADAPLLRSVGRDVTAQIQAETALRASEDFLSRTGRVAGVGGWELDLRAGKLSWSEQTRRIHEVGPDYVPTLQSGLDFYAPESRSVIEMAVQRAMDRGEGWDLELPLITATGRSIWTRAVGEVEFDDAQPIRLVGALQDITERKLLEQRIDESEDFVRRITDNLPVRIAYIDHDQRYRFVNLADCRHFDRERETIIGATRRELLPEADDPDMQLRLVRALAGEAQQFEFDETAGKNLLRIESRLIPDVAASGVVRGVYSIGFDITERSRSEREIQRQTTTMRAVIEAMPAIVSVVDRNLRYRFVNSAFERWYGVGRDEVVGRHARAVLEQSEAERSAAWAQRALAGETVQFERAYPKRPGAPHLAVSYIPLHLQDGSIDGFVIVALDITPHRNEAVRLQRLAERDPLTGLLNRTGFEARLEQTFKNGNGPTSALLYVDLDHFKAVNDNHGHASGDKVLQLFAQRLVRLVRPSDSVARLGGDEFALLLTGVHELANAQSVAAKVVAAGQLPFKVGTNQLQIGASVGVVHDADPTQGGSDLLARADKAMYRAKEGGRGRSTI